SGGYEAGFAEAISHAVRGVTEQGFPGVGGEQFGLGGLLPGLEVRDRDPQQSHVAPLPERSPQAAGALKDLSRGVREVRKRGLTETCDEVPIAKLEGDDAPPESFAPQPAADLV